MSKSVQEEIIAALWVICAILCFAHGFFWWGIAFSLKAASDTLFSVHFAFMKVLAERRKGNK